MPGAGADGLFVSSGSMDRIGWGNLYRDWRGTISSRTGTATGNGSMSLTIGWAGTICEACSKTWVDGTSAKALSLGLRKILNGRLFFKVRDKVVGTGSFENFRRRLVRAAALACAAAFALAHKASASRIRFSLSSRNRSDTICSSLKRSNSCWREPGSPVSEGSVGSPFSVWSSITFMLFGSAIINYL